MEFSDILLQVTRPYWSPVHPLQYIKEVKTIYHTRRSGWGLIFPDDIGAFNLLWLMSGVGGPPDDYKRYGYAATWVMTHGKMRIGRWTLTEAAARMSLRAFSKHIDERAKGQDLGALSDALRLRV